MLVRHAHDVGQRRLERGPHRVAAFKVSIDHHVRDVQFFADPADAQPDRPRLFQQIHRGHKDPLAHLCDLFRRLFW